MAQLDKELFFEYLTYIFLTLLHLYSSSYFNRTLNWLNVRAFYLNHFYHEVRSLEEQNRVVKNILCNFKK